MILPMSRMEFRTARLDEAVDEAHADNFRRVIVPLLRRRADFAGTEHFQLYDAVSTAGGVLQDVFAFSNGGPGRRTLVVVHNRFGDADVRIERSVPIASRDATGRRQLKTIDLGRALDLPDDGSAAIRFRDARSGREVRTTAGALRAHGLELHVGAYEALVFDVDQVGREVPAQAPDLAAPSSAVALPGPAEPVLQLRRRRSPASRSRRGTRPRADGPEVDRPAPKRPRRGPGKDRPPG